MLLEEGLQSLVGLPLSIARDALDMKIFHFGPIRPHPSGRGTVGAYALHIQCPWRIVKNDQVVTGSSDRYLSAYEHVDDEDPRSGNLQRVHLASLLQGYDAATKSLTNITDALIVLSTASDGYGGADLSLSGGYRLQIFPDGSRGEDWRFIKLQGRHLIVEAGQINVVG